MITAIVRFPLPPGTTLEDATAAFKASAPNYENVPGLIRKYYLYDDAPSGGGVYLWESREAANAVYTDEWKAMIAGKYGSELKVTYLETPVIVDNS